MTLRDWGWCVVVVASVACRNGNGQVDCTDLVDTPGGRAVRACVHQVPNGATEEQLSDGTTVVRVAGREMDRFGPCPCGDAGSPPGRQSRDEDQCLDAVSRYMQLLQSDPDLRDLAACGTDADCELWQPSESCEGTHLRQCSAATGLGRSAQAIARSSELLEMVCAPLTATCGGDPPCSSSIPRCVQGACVASARDGGTL
jgi:hypothetical protein